uniref:Uncharacterized protein n=1 Tax=Pararge aegeria TaxID=116150 RepID=S4NXX8_9NEOP
MKFIKACFLLFFAMFLVVSVDAYPFKSGNIDYLEALRRMRQIPQWHCMRYRRFQLHSPCNRWRMARKI